MWKVATAVRTNAAQRFPPRWRGAEARRNRKQKYSSEVRVPGRCTSVLTTSHHCVPAWQETSPPNSNRTLTPRPPCRLSRNLVRAKFLRNTSERLKRGKRGKRRRKRERSIWGQTPPCPLCVQVSSSLLTCLNPAVCSEELQTHLTVHSLRYS